MFYGIHNDFAKGQTATVHTPLNQSSDPNKWHKDILELTKHDIAVKNMPEMLINKCLPQTTSKAKSVIDYFFEFKNLLLELSRNSSSCVIFSNFACLKYSNGLVKIIS